MCDISMTFSKLESMNLCEKEDSKVCESCLLLQAERDLVMIENTKYLREHLAKFDCLRVRED